MGFGSYTHLLLLLLKVLESILEMTHSNLGWAKQSD